MRVFGMTDATISDALSSGHSGWIYRDPPSPINIDTSMNPPIKQKKRSGTAFTLIELLVVISIIIVLSSFMMPAFNSIMKAGGVSGAMNDVSGMIDIARTEAMGKRTYVCLGFQNATVKGSAQLWVVAARSLDGTPALTGNNMQVIGKVLKLDNIILTGSATLSQKTSDVLTSSTVAALEVVGSSATVSPGLGVSMSGSNTYFTQLVVFTPQGQALVTTNPAAATPPTPFTNQILIGLNKAAGTTTLKSSSDSVALVLNGGTGSVSVFRP
jgi:type IV fimbrial biogenesis protein FimT